MPPLRGGKSLVTIRIFFGIRMATLRRNELRPDRAVEVRHVPAGECDLLHVLAWNRRVNQVAATHIDANVRVTGEAENVARLEVTGRERTRRGVQRDSGQRGHLVVAGPGDGDPRIGPRGRRQARAVKASAARSR